MERVGIERPSARPPGERAFEDGADVVMHPTGAIDIRVSREDEVHASVLMRMRLGPSRPLKRMTPSRGRPAYVHDACTSPAYAAPATVAGRPASVRRTRCDR